MAKIAIEPVWPTELSVRKLKKMNKKLERYLTRNIGPKLIKDMEKTTKNWRRAPSFAQVFSTPFGNMQLIVKPVGRYTLKWKRISEGTGPRIINAKPGKMMVFRNKYSPKTTPAGRYGGPGRKFGPIVHRQSVYHSIEPRKFSKLIVERRENQILIDVNKVVERAAK
jgi:hypothetical protein